MKQSYEDVIRLMEQSDITFQQALDCHRSPKLYASKEEKKDHIKMRLRAVGNMDSQSAINTLKDCIKELMELI